MSATDLAKPPQRSHRQSIGSLNAIRASMGMDGSAEGGAVVAPAPLLVSQSGSMLGGDDVPEMIPYGVDARVGLGEGARGTTTPAGLVPLFAQLQVPSPVVEGRDPLEVATTESTASTTTPVPTLVE